MDLKLTRPLAFFDLETTGIRVAVDRIVEICILRINPDQTTNVFTQRVNPEIHIPEESTLVHGITDEDVKDAPTFAMLAHEINQFLMNCDLAGFNSNNFDIPLLMEEFLRAGVNFELKGRKFVDVQNIFHKMEPRNLKAAYKFYCDQDLENAHSAEADTRATYEILKAQLSRYEGVNFKDKNGKISQPVVNDVKALSEFSWLNRNADLVGFIIYNERNVEVFNFGKHKGKPVSDVFHNEPSYYDWIMKSEFPLTTKKVITEIKLRALETKKI
ncbi:MAG: exonuclease domain-containing protein [Bacteroidota bacterium]|nr:exonuclease domain-containing protein [Bacteroidota bacterium]